MSTLTIPITGMTCGGCVNSVRKVLTTIAGVQQAQVQIGSASVTYDPALTTPDALRGAIVRAGFALAA